MKILKIENKKLKFDLVSGLYSICALISLSFINFIVWLILLITGLLILSRRKEIIEIDITNKKIRRVINLYKYSTNNGWTILPEMKYVTIAKNFGHSSRSCDCNSKTRMNLYPVNLAVNDKKRIIAIKSYTVKEEAIKLGLQLGEAWNLKVLDYTTPYENWIR